MVCGCSALIMVDVGVRFVVQKEKEDAEQAALQQDDAPEVNICPPSPQNNLDPKMANFTP